MDSYIIYTDMVGDLCHSNHIKHLEKCKQFKKNSVVYVGLHSDETSQQWKRLPIMNMKERAYIFNSIKHVDKVILDAPIVITKEFINKHTIDMVIHAHPESENDKYLYQHKDAIELGKFTRFDYNEGINTTTIINRIKNTFLNN